MNRITALLGAGAAVDIGGPTSLQLTDKLLSQAQSPILKIIHDTLQGYFKRPGELVNFEDIFHAIEKLYSLWGAQDDLCVKKYKPHLGAFIPIKDIWTKLAMTHPDIELLRAQEEIIEIIAAQIAAYDEAFFTLNKHTWFSDFFAALQKRDWYWDIATLNYDTCVERSLASFEDGYEMLQGKDYASFSPRRLMNTQDNRVMHLHGCIFYGHRPRGDLNAYVFRDDFDDLFKFRSYQQARSTWGGRSGNVSQAGESALIGPLITGMSKTDKLLVEPYSHYSAAFQRAVLENASLLVVGYAFGDYHLNKILEKMSSYHGKNRRIVIVSYVPNPETAYHDLYRKLGDGAYPFLVKSFMEEQPRGYNLSLQSPLVSADTCCKLYLLGFKDALVNHEKEILDFLCSK